MLYNAIFSIELNNKHSFEETLVSNWTHIQDRYNR